MAEAPALVVLLTGPSGAGKSSLARQSGLPALGLDRFYKNGNDPALPRLGSYVDWDDPATWDQGEALDVLHRLAVGRRATLPMYDIRQSRRTGSEVLDIGSAPAFVAEGLFAALLVGGCRSLGILGDALCLHRRRPVTLYHRLSRDLADKRRSPRRLLHRAVSLTLDETATVDELVAHGAHPCRPNEALYRIRLASYARRLGDDQEVASARRTQSVTSSPVT